MLSAVHGIVALGLEEKLVSLPRANLRNQLAASVRAITAGRAELLAIDPVGGRTDLQRAVPHR